jgi:hypothetical protein
MRRHQEQGITVLQEGPDFPTDGCSPLAGGLPPFFLVQERDEEGPDHRSEKTKYYQRAAPPQGSDQQASNQRYGNRAKIRASRVDRQRRAPTLRAKALGNQSVANRMLRCIGDARGNAPGQQAAEALDRPGSADRQALTDMAEAKEKLA